MAAEVESNVAERIRKRASYRLFRQLYDFLKSGPNTAEILRKFYDVLDIKGGFGSRRKTEYAVESLRLVIKDRVED